MTEGFTKYLCAAFSTYFSTKPHSTGKNYTNDSMKIFVANEYPISSKLAGLHSFVPAYSHCRSSIFIDFSISKYVELINNFESSLVIVVLFQWADRANKHHLPRKSILPNCFYATISLLRIFYKRTTINEQSNIMQLSFEGKANFVQCVSSGLMYPTNKQTHGISIQYLSS